MDSLCGTPALAAWIRSWTCPGMPPSAGSPGYWASYYASAIPPWRLAQIEDPHPENSVRAPCMNPASSKSRLPLLRIRRASALVHRLNSAVRGTPRHMVQLLATLKGPYRSHNGAGTLVNRLQSPGAKE